MLYNEPFSPIEVDKGMYRIHIVNSASEPNDTMNREYI